jgi:polyhydroxybutyrate depolymerase
MRWITRVFISTFAWILFFCLLVGCSGLKPNTTRLESGTFRDDLNLRTGKNDRHFLLHIPEGYTASRPLPLVVVLHGAFSTAREVEKWSGWSQLADREGFIVIYPEGIGILGFLQHWNAGHCCGKALEKNWNDVAFIESAIDGICSQYEVDKQRIYMMGYSNGGMLTYRFAAERSSLLAAAASVAGAINSRVSQDQPAWQMPSPERAVPFLIMHGNADKAIPYEGKKAVVRAGKRQYHSVADAAGFWITANKTTQGPVRTTSFGGMVSEESWTDADNRNEVRVYRIFNWGHKWPGGSFMRDLPDGDPLKDFDAAKIIWRFFQKYPMD